MNNSFARSLPTTPGNRTIQPSLNSTNTTVIRTHSSTTAGTTQPYSPSSTSGTHPSSGSLFSLVFIASVSAAGFFFICLIILVICCRIRRRRSVNMTDKNRRRGLHNLTQSMKRTFVSDGPHYAVTNLSSSRCAGITARTPDEATVRDNKAGKIAINNKAIYQRYLTPIEGLPVDDSRSKDKVHGPAYIQPVDAIPVPNKIPPKTKDKPRKEGLNTKCTDNAVKVNNNLCEEAL